MGIILENEIQIGVLLAVIMLYNQFKPKGFIEIFYYIYLMSMVLLAIVSILSDLHILYINL